MSFLKKLGVALIEVGKVVPIGGPVLAALIPGTKDDAIIAKATGTLDQLTNIIVTTEAIGAALKLDGQQKLTAATPLFAQAFLQSSILAGREIADPVAFKTGVDEAVAAYVKILNSFKPDA